MQLPLEMLFRWEKEIPNQIYLRQPVNRHWQELTWAQAVDQVRRMAAYLKSIGLPAGSRIAIISKNCSHWILADYAIMASGHVSVPLYGNALPETVSMILAHSEAKLVFLGKLDKPNDVKALVPSGVPIIAFPYESATGVPRWDEITSSTTPLSGTPSRVGSELATIIYTSGTTGVSKGVMHSFHAAAFTASHMVAALKLRLGETFFSFQPLAHVAERVVSQLFPLYLGGTVSFAESPALFADNLREVSPTVFLGVPRIWSRFQEGVYAKLPPAKFDRLMKIPLINRLVQRKIRKALGLNTVFCAITGAAPMSPALMVFFARIGIKVQEAYAMTENFAYSHFNPIDDIRPGKVGQPWPEVQVKIGTAGEVMVKSEATMLGYYKMPSETAAMMENGYLKTGDVGEIDADGYLTITGRIKDIFKTVKGEYVAPSPIEMKLSTHTYLEQVCVVGRGMVQPFAVVVLNENARKLPREQIQTELETLLTQTNATLRHHEKLSHLVVVSEVWAVENQFLTPTLKVKRPAIEKEYQPYFEAWSQNPRPVLFA